MSKPAQRPPESGSTLEAAMMAVTEVLILSLSFIVGLSSGMTLVWIGVIPESASWSGVVLGSIAIGTAGVAYLGFEQVLAKSDQPVRPLVWKRERKHAGICVLIALGAIVVALAGSSLLALIQELLFDVGVEEQASILELLETGTTVDIALLSISAVVLAPVSEELLFRHMFFRRLRHRAGPTLAWILPALAFSLFHFNLSGLVIYVWLGLVFAYAYLLSGRLWVAMAVHAGHNAVALSLLLGMPEALVGV